MHKTSAFSKGLDASSKQTCKCICARDRSGIFATVFGKDTSVEPGRQARPEKSIKRKFNKPFLYSFRHLIDT